MRTLGIDPGFDRTGFGVTDACPHGMEMEQCYDCGYGDDHFFDNQIRRHSEQKELIEQPFRYRMMTIGELFLLWKHKELPLSWFPRDDDDTDATGNTVMNFWFGDEVIHMDGVAIVRAHKDSLSPIPLPKTSTYSERGKMRWAVTNGVRTTQNWVFEYYNTRVIPEDELEVALVRDQMFTRRILRLVCILEQYVEYRSLRQLLGQDRAAIWELENRYSIRNENVPIEQCQNIALVRFYTQYRELFGRLYPQLTFESPVYQLVDMFREFFRDMDYLNHLLPAKLERAEFGTSSRVTNESQRSRYLAQLLPFFKWMSGLPSVDLGSVQHLKALDHGQIEQLDWEKDILSRSDAS